MHKFSLREIKKVLFWKERFSRGTILRPVLFRFFVGLWENYFGLAIFFYQFTSQAIQFEFYVFFPKKIILILNLEEKKLAGQEKKIYSDLTFSQYTKF